MKLSYWLDLCGTLLVILILVLIYIYHFRVPSKRIWRCYRFYGGGVMDTPKAMTLQEATVWLGKSGAEVSHVDHIYGFIFYRPRGA